MPPPISVGYVQIIPSTASKNVVTKGKTHETRKNVLNAENKYGGTKISTMVIKHDIYKGLMKV
jgi:hypothetical protein